MITRSEIEHKIATDDRWLERGILAIWKNQTRDEKISVDTKYFNGIGFNGVDGKFMTSLGNNLNRGYHLSAKQKHCARKRMKKYCGQLERIAKQKAEDDAYYQLNTELAKQADAWLIKQFEEGKVQYVGV